MKFQAGLGLKGPQIPVIPAQPGLGAPFPFPFFPKLHIGQFLRAFMSSFAAISEEKKKRLKEQLVHQAAQSSSTELFIAANSYKK